MIRTELIRMLVTLLLSKLVAFRRRMTSSILGCVHCPFCRAGVEGCWVVSFLGVLRMGSALAIAEGLPVEVCDTDCEVVANAVDDMAAVC